MGTKIQLPHKSTKQHVKVSPREPDGWESEIQVKMKKLEQERLKGISREIK